MRKWFKWNKNERPESTDEWNDLLNKSLSASFHENLATFKNLYADSYDIVFRKFQIGEKNPAALIYIQNMADIKEVDKQVLLPLMRASDVGKIEMESMVNDHIPVASAKVMSKVSDCVDEISYGNPVLLIKGTGKAVGLHLNKPEKRQISQPENEPVIRGPKEGFTESLHTNTSLIRQKIRTPKLKMKSLCIGEYTRTEVAVAFIETLADQTLIEEVMNRLERIEIDGVLESGYIEEMIEDTPFTPFPLVKTTERVDVAAAHLLEGRVAIIVNGTPTLLLVPISLTSLMQAADDYYNRALFGSSFRILRLFSLFLSLILPALYVAITTFHQEMLPTDLLISIASAHEAIPFPTLIEALIMQLSFEVLREAGLRLPRQVGSAVTIVGALVVGQAAVNAGFASATMVIVVAITGITSFTAPHYALETAIRILRFILIILAGTLGMLGLVFGLLAITVHLCTLRSFGVPYLAPMAPAESGMFRDSWIRVPWWKMNKRPRLTGERNQNRQTRNLKPGPEKGK
ncbi:MAG TPA: spore germination protein [Bacillales bacterium]|nr:spore germination protein [Bacillales bacterium]